MKHQILSCIPPDIRVEKGVNANRVNVLAKAPIEQGTVVCLINRELRVKDNYVLEFAKQLSLKISLPLLVLHKKNTNSVLLKQGFLDRQITNLEQDFKSFDLQFKILSSGDNVGEFLKKQKTAALVFDYNPIIKYQYPAGFRVYEIDGRNIVPARYVSEKREYNTVPFRRKVYSKIWNYIKEFPASILPENEGEIELQRFIKDRLPYYAQHKNNPVKNVTSKLSGYLNLGFISAQRVALEVIKSNATDENKEIFLEELIIRRELAENFCLYSSDFKGFKDVPEWAKQTLSAHQLDERVHCYDFRDLELANTRDNLWNACQRQLLTEGIIHGYLRMYWAKKILEWSLTPEVALQTAITLNDKYAFDAPSPNGYVGILWSIGALHDRPFRDISVTGKIRPMSYKGIKSKFEIDKYIDKYS